ncbi:MAG: transcriptional regulator [Planctomycetota bacterium]
MQTVSLKIVTIIAETVLADKIAGDLMRLGAKGYTVTEARGEGSRHLRAGEIPGQNIKIESVVSELVAARIVDHVAQEYFSHYAVIVYVSDVAVVRGEKYI